MENTEKFITPTVFRKWLDEHLLQLAAGGELTIELETDEGQRVTTTRLAVHLNVLFDGVNSIRRVRLTQREGQCERQMDLHPARAGTATAVVLSTTPSSRTVDSGVAFLDPASNPEECPSCHGSGKRTSGNPLTATPTWTCPACQKLVDPSEVFVSGGDGTNYHYDCFYPKESVT